MINQTSAAPAPYQSNSTDDAYNGIMIKIMSLFAWLVGVAALTLNYAVYYTVITMGSYISQLSAVGLTWQILRDLGNIMLIFGFIAVGVTTILDVNWYGDRKKFLPMLLVAAVFLNFSLFISEAVIDVGNLFATQFYTQINGSAPPPTITVDTIRNVGDQGIAGKIMSQLGISTLYGGVQQQNARAADIFRGANPWFIGFLSILLFIILAFVLFSLAFVLIARFVILIFLIILSPVGFAGLAVPMLAKRAGQWWDKLFEQVVTAPILLLMLYIALKVITAPQFLTGFNVAQSGDNWVGSVTNNIVGFGPVLLSFLVAMGLLMLVVIQSKSLGAYGASWASQTAGKLSFGATAWAGRNTIGWGSHRLAQYARKSVISRVPLVGTGITRGLEGAAKSSFDARGVKVGGYGLAGGKVDAGDAQKGGYRADLKAGIDSRTKYAAGLKGRDLTANEKGQQVALEKEIADYTRQINDLHAQQIRNAAEGRAADPRLDTQISVIDKLRNDSQGRLKTLNEGLKVATSDSQAKRDYARGLNLWTDENNFFNRKINSAKNTEAAEKIRGEAKKSTDDKTLEALKNALKKIGDEPGGGAAPPAGAAPGGKTA